MPVITQQAWVTSVLRDDEVRTALSLCYSLKKVLTSRKVVAIFSDKLSSSNRMALLHAFDECVVLNEDWNKTGLKIEDFAKLYILTLKSFQLCIYLSTTMLVIKNCDEIFYSRNATSKSEWPEQDMSIFVVQPSLQMFQHLSWNFRKQKDTNNSCMRTLLIEKNLEFHQFLDSKYFGRLDFEYDLKSRVNTDVSIFNVVNIPYDADITKLGLIHKMVLTVRNQIDEFSIKPLLQSVQMEDFGPFSHCLGVQPPFQYNKESIAIVGMSCRYPGANNLDEFWKILVNGEDATGNPPEFRWLPKKCIKPFRNTNAGFLKCPVDSFDATFFGISPMEVSSMDPQHRILHEVVWESLEDAAINPQSLKGSMGGVFVGTWSNEFKEMLACSDDTEFYRSYMGNSIGNMAARISFLLGMTGPSIATESGCSSSMAAVHLACKSLQNNESSLALACGVNLMLEPFDHRKMLMTLSQDGLCKTFDAAADGFGRAEGVAVLVLKRLSDAVKNGDRIWALVRGTAMTQEGMSKSMGTPTVNCEALAMTQALTDARIDPGLVSYVEAHGTGTVVGDPIEVEAISRAYHSKKRKEPLIIGSVKTNIGHTESCAGIAGIMKVVLAMKNEVIPAHIHFKTLNPLINLEEVPAQIPLNNTQWKMIQGEPRFAGVSSFGITGTDAHAIIEESPDFLINNLTSGVKIERPLHIMKICAKNEEALSLLLESYKQRWSSSRNDDDFKDLAFTANTGRPDFNQRVAIIASSTEEAIQAIEQQKFIIGNGNTFRNTQEKTCFLFTGQGSQYPGMAKDIYETSPIFRIHFEYCQDFLKNMYDINIAQILWSEDSSRLAEIGRTIYSQTSIFCVEYALLKLIESWGLKAEYALGHSLGEFAAAVCAGILNVQDALKLVAERSLLIDALPQGRMLVIKADKFQVNSRINEFSAGDPSKILDVAALNSNEQTVVAGDINVISEFQEFCKKSGLKCSVLDATHAFHSKHMDPMLEQYKAIANTVAQGKDTSCKFISGMRGQATKASSIDANYWVDHTREKVEFLNASKQAVELGCVTFLEIGPQPVLSALTKMNSTQELVCLPTLRKNLGNWITLLDSVAKLYVEGVEVDWKGFDRFYTRKKVSIPHYPFIRKKFWPEIASPAGTTLHPLLGSALANPSPIKIYKSGLNTSTLEYIKDHCIGNHIIFPGAGYLEMAIAAGLTTVENCTDSLTRPVRPFKIQNLTLESPLELKDTKSCPIQTIVCFNSATENAEDWNDLTVKTYKKNESNSVKWVLHSASTFCPFPSSKDTEVEFDQVYFKETLQKRPETTSEFYTKMCASLAFGPAFRIMEKIWKNESGDSVLVKVKPCSQHSYIVHPVILDAMMQAISVMFPISNWRKMFYVPVKIGKFVWLSEPTSLDIYVYAQKLNSTISSASALLVDANSQILAVMSGVELMETHVKAIESVLEQQSSPLPSIWEEIWRKTPSPVELSTDMEKAKGLFCDESFHQKLETEYNQLDSNRLSILQNLEKLAHLNFLRALYELGWEPPQLKSFVENSLFEELGIKPQFRKLFSKICEFFEDEGLLKKVELHSSNLTEWLVCSLPSYEETMELLNSQLLSSELVKNFLPTLLIQELGKNFSSILNGSQSPLPLLFPEEGTFPEGRSIVDFYPHARQLFKVAAHKEEVTQKILNHIRESQSGHKFKLKILEVGAGTGAYSQTLINHLETQGIQFEYTYTDISSAFFGPAEKKFATQLNSIRFKRLNIEEDPLEQGFIPEYFDFVLAAEVIHATRNIVESLRHIRTLMKPFGRLLIYETTSVRKFITFVFGTLEGYWRFQDFNLRQKHCTLETWKWEKVLNSSGLPVEKSFSIANDRYAFIVSLKSDQIELQTKQNLNMKPWLIFHLPGHPVSDYLVTKFQALPGRRVITVMEGENSDICIESGSVVVRKQIYEDFHALLCQLISCQVEIEGIVYCWSLDNTVTEQEQLLQPYFNLTKSLVVHGKTPKLTLITNGVVSIGDNSNMSGFHASTLWGYTKSMKNENFAWNVKCIDIAESISTLNGNRLREVFLENWNTSNEFQVAFSENSRLVPKFTPTKSRSNLLKLPNGSPRFQLVLPETGSISDLKFGSLEPTVLADSEVEIGITAYALSFRDMLTVLNSGDEFSKNQQLGCDVVGVITKVGSKVEKWSVGETVIGCNFEQLAFPSHLKADQDHVVPCPDTWNFSEAATIPSVYITVIRCLIEIAKIKKRDTVLIHTATGAVGLSAIEICKYVGCNIISTAGSNRKKNYLRSLGIQHIFHSRNTEFGSEILELTEGRGVDVVLNSLTSPGFKEATLMSCAKNARFVEMSRLNVWRPEEVQKLRPDVSYTLFYLAEIDHKEKTRCIDLLQTFIDKGVVKPLPNVIFDALNIREALQYMQQAKHIGKIVCMMPKYGMEQGTWSAQAPMFGNKSTYLITGGCGGIGFEVCRWMLKNGAVNVILASRNPPSLSVREQILEMNSKGDNVTSVELDVGKLDECKKLVDITIPSRGLPPLKGIMHAAGVISDGPIATMEWAKLSYTFGAKITGTLNLHEISKKGSLEFFVIFSSIASMFGNTCQSNHSAANAFEDAFTNYRHSQGLPVATINWGQWGQVGMAKETEITGFKPLSTLQGITGLEYVMKTQRLQAAIPNIDSYVTISKFIPMISSYLDERVSKISVVSSNSVAIRPVDFWKSYDSAQSSISDKTAFVKQQVRTVVRNSLKLECEEIIDDTANLRQMGMDSLLFIEIRNSIQVLLGERVVVSTNVIKNCDTVNDFASTLVDLFDEEIAKQKEIGIFEKPTQLESSATNPTQRILLAYTIHNLSSISSTSPIFIAHGSMGERSEWDDIAKVIAKQTNRKVITFDARSHGDSPSCDEHSYEIMAEDLLYLSKHLDIHQFSLIGHSMGGRTGMMLALKYPEMLEELIVVDVSPFEENYESPNAIRWSQTVEGVLLTEISSEQALHRVKKELDKTLKAMDCSPEVRAYGLANLICKDGKVVWAGKPSLDVLIRNLDVWGKFPKACLNNQFGKPTLFLKSEKSDYITYEVFPKIRHVFTNAEINVIQNANHFPHVGAYNGFMEAVLRFLLR